MGEFKKADFFRNFPYSLFFAPIIIMPNKLPSVKVTYLCQQLIVEFGVRLAVLVRCFVNKRAIENQIMDKVGVGFTEFLSSL